MFQPQIGDVLVTKDYIVGIMVQFERKATFVSGQYYSFTYPSEYHLKQVMKMSNDACQLANKKKEACFFEN